MKLNNRMNRIYHIEPYNPEWVLKFNVIKENISKIFKEKAIAIEHMGSTSIPGMSAKPLIDVLIVVAKIEPFTEEKSQMESLGYLWGENYIAPDTLIFFKEESNGSKTENIHVCVKGSFKANQFIQTRDYVRTHPERAMSYTKLKKELKLKYPDDYQAYRDGKQAFLDETERLTYEWVKNRRRD
jgi:GrpB-like predicted nucleotidyltransferase (UPF0157 family)